MESMSERFARLEREREEELKEYKLQQQLKIKKMTKIIGGSIVGLFLMVFLFKSCERIDAGHVGVKVNLYGDNKGVSDVTEVTGMVFYNPITHSIYEFPTFIQQKYEESIASKEMVIKTHEFILNPDLPEDEPGNKFSISWEEDHIVAYKVPKTYALKRPTWEINPTRSIEDFKIDFYKNAEDALSRFACMPPEAVDAFFKSREKIETAFNNPNLAVDSSGRYAEWFRPIDDKEYFIHVDLAQKHDHCAVSLAHVEKWVNMKVGNEYAQSAPVVVVDAVRFWTPTASKSVDFTDVKDYILSLRQRGFNIKLTTFDRWNSHDMMQQLRGYGMNTELLSVAKKHYEDMAMIIAEERVKGPRIDLLIDELLQLRIMRDRVDHPRKGSKDLADAVCGSIYNAIVHSKREKNREVEIHTYGELIRDNYLEEEKNRIDNLIRPPRRMPQELAEALDNMEVI